MAESSGKRSPSGVSISQCVAGGASLESTITEKNRIDPWIVTQHYYHGYLPRQDVSSILTQHGDFLVRSTEVNISVIPFMLSNVRKHDSVIILRMLEEANEEGCAYE
ncbi:hypothetical protein ANCCAN_17228 [Ancylostoma caninum]|uniref:SH2 domain-containing protein n=1 Tax=Ancylostoma caninum TaxID=29170 RepID=A0A368G1N9_ANCCA|nr:hypothetical protein ANCCAN_17228 [Ancylostoma caninum]